MRVQQRFQKSDLFWLCAYPLYQVIGTMRHEGSHALVALLEGAKIEQFAVLPSFLQGQIAWGYVSWYGRTDWVPLAAPYLCDLLTYLLVFLMCTRLPMRRHWIWINLIILGLISPLVNSSYEYLIAFLRSWSDIAQLLHELPPLIVHVYFVTTLLLYMLGLLALLRAITGSMPASEAKQVHS